MQSLSHGSYVRTPYDGPTTPGVYPRFFLEAVQDEMASREQGRPIFKEVEFVEIIIPGDRSTRPVKRVDDELRNRWAEAYQAFKAGIEPTPDGTPLKEWAILNGAQRAELSFLGFRTVEDIANAPDTAIQKIPAGYGLRERAKAWLDDGAAMALTEKLSAENDQLRAELASVRRQMDEQGELLRQVHADMIARNNAPHPIASTAPMNLDPLAVMGGPIEPAATSSLAEFDQPIRRRGRPPKTVEPAL